MYNLRNKKRKILTLFLVCAMVCSLMPGGFARPQKAAAATTALYITDNIGGDSTFVDTTENQSGTGWSWDAESETLTLSGFNGERIEAEGDLTVVLSGINTITLPATQGGNYTYGIKSGTNLTITDDTNNEEDVVDELAITQTAFSAESLTTSCHYYGLYASNNVKITGGNVSIDIRESSDSNNTSRTMQVDGVYATTAGRTTVSNSARLDINIEGQHIQGQGVFGTLYAQTTEPISINVDGCPTETYQFAAKGIYASGTGVITLSAVTGWANDGKLEVLDGAGTINFNGAIRIATKDNEMSNSAIINIASDKKFTVPEDTTGFAYYAGTDTSNSGYVLCREDGSKVTSAKLETVENNPLTFAGNPGLDMSGLKVGTYYSGKYFHGLVSGGTKNYTFSVDPENPLPAGLQVLQNSGSTVYAYIYGTPTEACEEGTARIIVKDSSEPQQEASIYVNYNAVEVSNPVTGVSLDKDELILNYREEYPLTYTISPNDATIQTVTWNSSNSSIVRVNEGTVIGACIGKATVTVTTTQGNLTDTCDVYVKESQPDARIDYNMEALTGLVTGAKYIVSGSEITDESFTAESSTYSIKSEWLGKTISLVKTNDEPKCNSDAQQVDIPERLDAPTTPTAVYESFEGAGDGIISGLTYQMEYRKRGETEWISVSGNTVSGLETGTYEVRMKATSSSFAGKAISLSIGTKDFDFVDDEQFDIPAGPANTKITEIDLSSGVSGGTKPYIFSKESGPSWIEVSSTGKISGTRPSDEGEASTAVIQAEDAKGAFKRITISVGEITHAHNYVKKIKSEKTLETAADCTHDAFYYFSCECGAISSNKSFNDPHTALGHDYEHHDGKAATCTEVGWEAYDTCSRCDYTTYKAIESLGHDLEHHDGMAATCTEDGWEAYDKCSRCDYTTYKEIKALGHRINHDEIKNLTPATTSAAGSYEVETICDVCHQIIGTKTVSILKIGTVSLSKEKLTYTGSGQAPSLTVKDAKGNKLVKGTDYTVSGLDKKTNVGRYKVTVTFKGNYSGKKELYFTIVPKTPASAKATLTAKYGATAGYDDVKFSWSKVGNASGYAVYYKRASAPASAYTLLTRTTGTSAYKKNLSDGVKYTFKVVPYYKASDGNRYENETGKTATVYTLKKLSAPTLSRSGSKVKVKWTNINGETGYQISKSTSKTGTNIVSTYATTSGTYKLISATKGKTYYYKVRSYKKVDGKNIYGPWSSVNAFKR